MNGPATHLLLWRLQKKLKRIELARTAEIKETRMRDLERGLVKMEIHEAITLADIMGITLMEILRMHAAEYRKQGEWKTDQDDLAALIRGACRDLKEHYKARNRAYYKEWYQKNKGNLSARRTQENHKQRAQIRAAKAHTEQQPCESCGRKPAFKHHDDYGKPENVRWLCRSHHAIWHRDNTPRNNAHLSAAIKRREEKKKLLVQLESENRRKSYNREWQERNRDKLRTKRKERYHADIERSRARSRENARKRWAADPQGCRAKAREYRRKNIDKVRASERAYNYRRKKICTH